MSRLALAVSRLIAPLACAVPSVSAARSFMRRLMRLELALGMGLLPLAIATPVRSAEEIRVLYGPIQLSVSVESLATFAETGTIEPDLAAYADRFTEQQLQDIRRVLNSAIEVDEVALTNFLYTPQGEALLNRLGEVIRTRSNTGFYALRASLILAASQRDGTTPIDFLQEFPTNSVVVDVDSALSIASELNRLINVTSEAFALVEDQYQEAIRTAPPALVDSTAVPRRQGSYVSERETFVVEDPGRDRQFSYDLYLPDRDTPAPVIVISHGLGSDRTSYAYLARHLASYGFVVALPEHPGSNAEYIQALFAGAAEQVADPSEFVDRAQDISSVLDDLTRRAAEDAALAQRLDVNQAGVVGQSFGGYTALAIAGATIEVQRLQTVCDQEEEGPISSLNVSLLLQCRAVELFPQEAETAQISLRDERVKAIIAINPIGSTVFGREGFSAIDIPIMIITGSADVVAPPLSEQILPFTWLTAEDKYLLLMRGGTHFSTIGASEQGSETVPLPPEITGTEQELALARQYVETLSVAFFKTYVSNQPEFRVYLSPTYVNRLSASPLPLNIVQSLNADRLAQLIKNTSLVVSALELE
ncbi:MAG: alpha/beta hydrolase [Synechococcales bacterium]|nr:alpha/beta hydrolase [Synechococcales bacterium]